MKPSDERTMVMNLVCGNWLTQTIYVSVRLQLADYLSTQAGTTLDALAHLTHTHKPTLQRIVDILCAYGFYQQKGNMYYLTSQGKLLQSTADNSLYAYILLNSELYEKIWQRLHQSVSTGLPACQLSLGQEFFKALNQHHPQQAKLYDKAMSQKYKIYNQAIENRYQSFNFFKSVVDIGGGMGELLTTLLHNHPHLSGVLFDLPDVIERIPDKNAQSLTGRIAFVAGDFFKAIPKANSPTLYILKAVLHDWQDTQALIILENCKKVMSEQDVLLIVEKALANRQQSSQQALMNLHMFLLHGGNERHLPALMTLIKQAGLATQLTERNADDGSQFIEARVPLRAKL